jgi:hypothetical protein
MNDARLLQQALELERKANQSTIEQWDAFASHRRRLTALLLQDVPKASTLTLCVLGAGNCNDLDLALLLQHYAEVHLVDLDVEAVERACVRQAVADSARLRTHPALDLTCALDKLQRWAAMQVTEDELIAHPAAAAKRIAAELGQSFDRVVSPCLWTQFQLHALRALGARHRLLDAVQYTLGLTHLRLFSALLAPQGLGLLVTELTANTTYDLSGLDPDAEHLALVAPLVAAGNAIGVATPTRTLGPLLDDPVLRTRLASTGPCSAWIWSQGPTRSYLTYASWLSSLVAPIVPAPGG